MDEEDFERMRELSDRVEAGDELTDDEMEEWQDLCAAYDQLDYDGQ